MKKEYTIVKNLNDKVEELDKKIDNIGDDNIIGHSTVDDINGLIKDINKDIKKVNRKNKVMTSIKNIRIFGTFIRFFFPFVFALGAAFFPHYWVTKDIPFYPQGVFKFAHHNESIDKTGIVSDDIVYSSDQSNKGNTAEIITKWEQKPDGKWYRVIKTYNSSENYSLEQLLEFAKNENLDVEALFGKVDNVKFEVKNNISQEEKEQGDYLTIIYRHNNEEDVMLLPQDFWPNVGYTVLFFLWLFVTEGVAYLWRSESEFNSSRSLKLFEEKYKNIDISEIKKLFEEKKIKFERRINPEVTLTDPITGEKQIIKK